MTPEKLVASERQAWLDEERRASSISTEDSRLV